MRYQVGLHDSQQPSAMTTREIEEASAADEELSAVRQCINRKPWDQLVSYKQYLKCSGELCTNVKLILRGTRIVIPKKLRPRVLSIAHEGPWASLELSKSFVAKCGGTVCRETQRNILKPSIGGSWSVVPLHQSLLGPHPYQLDRGEIWLLICSDHFLLVNPF